MDKDIAAAVGCFIIMDGVSVLSQWGFLVER